jgi:hypothetical protein
MGMTAKLGGLIPVSGRNLELPEKTTRFNNRQISTLRQTAEPLRIIKRLKHFMLEESDEMGFPVVLNANQIRAAAILLAKCLPDLQSMALHVTDDLEDQSTAQLEARLALVLSGRKAEAVDADVIDVPPKPALYDLLYR